MGGNENRVRTGLQCDFQEITAVQTEDGTAIGVNISNGFELDR